MHTHRKKKNFAGNVCRLVNVCESFFPMDFALTLDTGLDGGTGVKEGTVLAQLHLERHVSELTSQLRNTLVLSHQRVHPRLDLHRRLRRYSDNTSKGKRREVRFWNIDLPHSKT